MVEVEPSRGPLNLGFDCGCSSMDEKIEGMLLKTAIGLLTTYSPFVHSSELETIGVLTIGAPVILTVNDFSSPTREKERTDGCTVTVNWDGIETFA